MEDLDAEEILPGDENDNGRAIIKRPCSIPSSPDWPFPCVICGNRFEYPSHVGKHVEEAHMYNGPAMCDVCGKVFKTPGGMTRHKRTHTGEKPYKCSHCSGTFAQWSTWRKHELTHLKSNKEFQCFSCEAYFDQERELEAHTKSGPCSGQKFDCCGTVFESRSDFVQHQIKKHRRSETKLHACQYCNKVFSLYTDKRIHEEAHIDRGKNVSGSSDLTQCPKCNKYVGASGYQEHVNNCIDKTKESQACDLCKMEFVSRNDMLHHRKTHINANTAFPCKICGKVLKSRASRYTHMMYHTAAKKHICNYCNKGFVIRAHLVTHIRMHTGEKPFSCTICGKSFSHNQSRRNHEATHSKTKSFKCSYCSKAFNTAQGRMSHERFHTGERPFTCKFCNQKFLKLTTLKSHERLHTGEKPYSCKICDKTFAQSAACVQHMKTHKVKKLPEEAPEPEAAVVETETIVHHNYNQPSQVQQIHHIQPTHYNQQPQQHNQAHEEWIFDQTTGNQMYVVVNNLHHQYQ